MKFTEIISTAGYSIEAIGILVVIKKCIKGDGEIII